MKKKTESRGAAGVTEKNRGGDRINPGKDRIQSGLCVRVGGCAGARIPPAAAGGRGERHGFFVRRKQPRVPSVIYLPACHSARLCYYLPACLPAYFPV